MAPAMNNSSNADDARNTINRIEWAVEQEISLFHAMRRHKPVGVNRHFHMACLHDKMNHSAAASNKVFSTKQIWEHIGTMYDLLALNESEIIPFPNKETDFSLPASDYGVLLSELEGCEEKVKMKTSLTKDTSQLPAATATVVKTEKSGKSTIEKSEKSEKTPKSLPRSSTPLNASTPDNSPKRKRTRLNQSQNPSPATTKEDVTPKRGRRT